MRYATLMEAQMGTWSDSVVLTDRQMLELLQTAIPNWLKSHKIEDWNWYDARFEINEWYAEHFYYEWRALHVEQHRAQLARGAFMCRAEHPDGFFYACGNNDGTYRHIGFRYGLEDCEYMSGFTDMTYTP